MTPAIKVWAPAACALGIAALSACVFPPSSRANPTPGASFLPAPIDSATWIDHDGQPIERPAKRAVGFYGNVAREAVIEPISHAFDVPDKILWIISRFGVETKSQASNVNAYDEVPNSTWFTNRNHFRSMPLDSLRHGPFGAIRPAAPLTITAAKQGGTTSGFQIKDADGKKWLFKPDPPGHPQSVSGADVISSRILYAAGYNISHDEAVSFRREDLRIDPEFGRGAKGAKPFTDADLDSLLLQGAQGPDGRYFAEASLFLPGKPVGNIDSRIRRPDDSNDLYHHNRRRELRGLFVLDSWLGSWDETDLQSLDMFQETTKHKGHVVHNLLDVGSSLGAAKQGAKPLSYGYEYGIDYGWTALRLITLGFVQEPWRRARQETNIPSVGNFESQEYEPKSFRTLRPYPPFRDRTLRDDYWGAKLVASFSDAQIEAAIEAAGYEDPRAREFLLRTLIQRRDKVVRYWFGLVAPLDFFRVEGGELRFHDLAVDRGLEAPRSYDVRVEALEGRVAGERIAATGTTVALAALGNAVTRVRLVFSLIGRGAKPAVVELTQHDGNWAVSRVRHG